MGYDSLHDLKLAGINWELSENPRGVNVISEQKLVKKSNTPVTNISNDFKHTDKNIIPPIAPIFGLDIKRGAGDATSIDELLSVIQNTKHPLDQFANNTVSPHFGELGTLVIITDMPTGDDEKNNKIMTGGAGELMDKMLDAIGLSRTSVSIVPLVFWRTPGGRTPTTDELELARPLVDRFISLIKPVAILTLGTLAATETANAKIPKDHGEIIESIYGIPAMPIYHPNYMILKPDTKRDVWSALQKLQNLLKISKI